MACPTLIWWEVLNGFIRLGFGTWGVPQGVPKCFRKRGYGQNGLDPLDPNITTLAGSVWAGLGCGGVVCGWVGLLIFLGQKHLNFILFLVK